MAAADVLPFIAPEFDSVDPAIVSQALTIAEGYRPACLTSDMGDQAVAFYAAWLLATRTSMGSGGSITGNVIMEQAGDTARRYASPTTTTDANTGSYKARFDALAALCSAGGILTRFG